MNGKNYAQDFEGLLSFSIGEKEKRHIKTKMQHDQEKSDSWNIQLIDWQIENS